MLHLFVIGEDVDAVGVVLTEVIAIDFYGDGAGHALLVRFDADVAGGCVQLDGVAVVVVGQLYADFGVARTFFRREIRRVVDGEGDGEAVGRCGKVDALYQAACSFSHVFIDCGDRYIRRTNCHVVNIE